MAGACGGIAERWRASVDPSVRTCRWEDGLIVYRADSGDTFLFDVAVLKILDWLAAGPAAASDVLALLDDEVFGEEPEDLLARLEQAGLIAREAAC